MASSNSSSDHQALAFGLAAVGLWSTMATAFKWALEYSSPIQLITLAATVSWLFFAIRLARRGELSSVFALSRVTVFQCLALGLLNPALFYWILFQAYDLLPAQDAMAINYTWGLTLPLIAAFFSRVYPSRNEVLLASLSYLGILIIVTDGDLFAFKFNAPLGVLLALFSTVLWGLSWVLNSRIIAHKAMNAEIALLLNFTVAVPVLWALTLLYGDAPKASLGVLAGGLYVGLFEMGIAFVFWIKAMQLTKNPIRISSLIFLAPPLSLALISTVLGEAVSVSTVVGLFAILAGLAGQQFVSRAT